MGNGLTYPEEATPFLMAGLRGKTSKLLNCGHVPTGVLALWRSGPDPVFKTRKAYFSSG